MDRRTFLSAASTAVITQMIHPRAMAESGPLAPKPMDLGLLVSPFGSPEATIKRVHDLGFSNCFLSLDGYIGKIHPGIATEMQRPAAQIQRHGHHR